MNLGSITTNSSAILFDSKTTTIFSSSREELLVVSFSLSSFAYLHTRRAQPLVDLIGILGGLGALLYALLNLSLSSFREQSFMIRALKRLYFARSSD